MPIPKISVKIEMREDEYKRLQEIKKHYNLSYDTEAIRLALGDAYKIMKERIKILSSYAKKEIDQV